MIPRWRRAWWRATDPLRAMAYRVFYCTRHGHQYKFAMPHTCINCGRPRKGKP